MQVNYITADIIYFEIGGKRQLELFLSNDDNKCNSRADHDDDDYRDQLKQYTCKE